MRPSTASLLLALLLAGCGTAPLPPNQPPQVNMRPPVISSVLFPTQGELYRNTDIGVEFRAPSGATTLENYTDRTSQFIVSWENPTKSITYLNTTEFADVQPEKISYRDQEPTRFTTIAGRKVAVFESADGYCDGPGCTPPYAAIGFANGTAHFLEFSGDATFDAADEGVAETWKLF